LLNIEDVANRLSISPSLVRRYIRDGKLESVKLGDRRLIEERAIAALIADVAAGR
jgi:excisionase family DNA binding protein